MNVNARMQSVIEIIDEIINCPKKPADYILQKYLKNRRFIGSSDRRIIGDFAFAVLRFYHALNYSLESNSPRLLTFFYLMNHCNHNINQIEQLCCGGYAPNELTENEKKILVSAKEYNQYILPEWLGKKIPDSLLPFLFQQAPFDVRVNTLRNNRDFILDCLLKEGYEANSTVYSPLGIRFLKRLPLHDHKFWKDGTLEVQEEASQLVAILCNASPHMNVLDYCSGAGGKALALAASMKNTGRLVLSDISVHRLNRAKERLRRAGVSNYQIKDLNSDKVWFKRHHNYFDRVLVDAPCSGSGTWRRNPDLKMRFLESDLNELVCLQKEILKKSSLLVKSGGCLIYATCSFFEDENKNQIEDFLKENSNFEIVPIQKIWQETIKTICPVKEEYAQFLTNLHNTDCFFVCVLQRKL